MTIYNFPILRLFLLFLVFNVSSYSQNINDISDNLIERLDLASMNRADESIYLQTSKGIYETEEDVWFKAYVLNSKSFIPSNSSKTLYVQLIEEKSNQPVWQEKYEIKNGFVDGHLYLHDTLVPGTYSLQAYSPNSFYRNTQDFHALRKMQIVKSISKNETSSIKSKDSIIDFNTFPEGGDLISGIRNRLAFKAVNSNGEPVKISGTLFENNKPLIEFNSMHAGMGSLGFIPDIKNKYHIELTKPKTGQNYSLPEIKRNGISLRLLRTTKEFLFFELNGNNKALDRTVYFQLQIRGEVYNMATTVLDKKVKIKVPLKNLPQGIAQVTVYNSNLLPVSERLVYVNLDRKLNIKTTILDQYSTREKAFLKIEATNAVGQPVRAHLGLSIFDKIYQNPIDAKNILSHFYLSTQLKGRIYDPSYYFNRTHKNRFQSLDLLLLTQGWRNYVWNEEELVENKVRKKRVVFDGLEGRTTFQGKQSKIPDVQPVLMAYVPDSQQKDIIEVDSFGQFKVTPNHLKMGEKGNVYFKLIPPPNSKFNFNFTIDPFESLNNYRIEIKQNYPQANLNLKKEIEIEPYVNSPGITQLDEVMLKTKKRFIKRDKYLGDLDSLAKLEMTNDYVCKENILNCPVHGPGEKGSKKPVEDEVYHMHWRTRYKLNGRSVEGGSTGGPILNPPLPPYHYPVLTDEYLMSRYNLIKTKGYYGHREFYQPKYDKEVIEDSFPDYRNTLVWNPSIITDENGEATIEFYCSDLNSNFIGKIEGVSGDGLLGNESFEFTVRKLVD